MVTLYAPAPKAVVVVVTVKGDVAVATADCTAEVTAASLGGVAKVAVKVTVL